MKKKDLKVFKETLEKAQKYRGIKFAYAVNKNLKLAEDEYDFLESLNKPSEEFQKYEEERNQLIRTHSQKDEQGNIKHRKQTINEKELIIFDLVDPEAYKKDMEVLIEKYRKALEERESQEKEYNSHLEEDLEIEIMQKIRKVHIDLFPQEITGEELAILEPMVSEE